MFYVLEWSVFGVMLMPDKDKVEECDKCTRLAIHTFTKCDHEAFSLDWVCYLKLEMHPWDGPKFFLSVTFEKVLKIIHVGCHLMRQLDRLWNGETHTQVVRLYQ